MAEWQSYYKNEDDDVEEEEGEDSTGDYKYSGRDSLVFLVDASREMFTEGEDGEPSNFDMTMEIISSDKDLVALVFYGTEKSKNPKDSFKNVYVYHDLESPGAKRVREVDSLRGEKGAKLAAETLGSGETCLGQALWCCSNLYSDIKLRLSHKRLMIFTCRDYPHGGNSDRDKLARTKAADLKETGVVIDLMHLKKDGGFDVSLFFCDIMSPPEGEDDIGLQLEPCGKLEDLKKRVRAKEMKKRAQSRLTLSLGEGVNVAVGLYVLARTATKPYAIKLYRDTNEPIRTKTRLYHNNTGSLLLPSDTKRAQVYGHKQIVLEKEEVDELKKFDDPGLVLMGSCVITALLRRCSERGVFAVCKYTPRRNTPPRFVALVPQREELDSAQTQNPVLQQHFRNLEALALDLTEPEPIEDLTKPKVEVMDQRLGPLVQEFKDLVYPADYNPEGKTAVKRKPEGGGGAEKKPKVELPEAELRAHIANGTLGKLTVPVLKDACKQFGVRTTGTKKQELIDALTVQFSR
ncbi:hypothetical protein JZ751_025291 [Albula glossodonta]|uniref:DNA helicase n=1 Tax=Albula glossodonta TaxID=121402 RepID=A0A8T2NIQ9_9TELE|nr:hypothetical protein JZ751_025291 [Albula glossodonta]